MSPKLQKLLYMPRCLLCGERMPVGEEQALCRKCADYVAGEGGRTGSLALPYCDDADAPLCYAGKLRRAMIQYKFHGKQSCAAWFAEQTAACVRAHWDEWQPDGLTYVPLSFSRWWKRGYNQAELVAREMGEMLALPCERTLRRYVWSRRQSRLDGNERMKNAEKAFYLHTDKPLAGRRLILVDDIITTGATASACARILRDAGCASVYVVSVMKV